jgi:hypothetical protein
MVLVQSLQEEKEQTQKNLLRTVLLVAEAGATVLLL